MLFLILNIVVAIGAYIGVIRYARRDPEDPQFRQIVTFGLPIAAALVLMNLLPAALILVGAIAVTMLGLLGFYIAFKYFFRNFG